MKKILSIFALVLCAITLPLGLVGCKKENGPDYIVGKTYKYSSIKMVWESEKEKDNWLTENNFENEEAMIANGANEYKSNIVYIKSESLIYLGKEVNVDEIEEARFNYYTINDKRVLTIYDSSMTDSIEGSYFSKDYTKFYFKYDLNEKGTTYALITFSCK